MSEAAAEKPAAAAPGGNKKLLLMVLIFNVVIAGGLGYLVISGRNQAAAPAKKAAAHGGEAAEGHEAGGEEEEAEEEESKGKHGSKFGPLLEVGSFIANLSASAEQPNAPSRYAKVSLFVEAKDEETKATVEGALVPIKSEALIFLSSAKPEDLIGADKIRALTEELQKRIQKLVGKNVVKRVYFSELVVQ